MLPVLRPGDRVLLDYRAVPEVGDVVLARFADGTLVVKRYAESRAGGAWLLSDNPEEGVDSRHRGPIALDRVSAVARVRVSRLPRLLRRSPARM